MDEKYKDSGVLPQKETGTAVHDCFHTSASVHGTERSLIYFISTLVDWRLIYRKTFAVRTLLKNRFVPPKA